MFSGFVKNLGFWKIYNFVQNYSILNNTMHECDFDRVVIFFPEYNYKVKITQVHVLFILNTTSAAK